MINNYIQFISHNAKGLQSLEKRIKDFEYLKNSPVMVLCFFKRRTPRYLMKRGSRVSLKENFFSHTGIAARVEWLL